MNEWPPKHPSASLDYAVDFELDCARQWDKWTDYSTGTRIRVFNASSASGYEFEATTGGRSGGRPPQWSTSGTVTDGSVEWTPRALSSSSLLRTLSGTPTWSGTDGITIGSVSVSGLVATAEISGGTDGQNYDVTVTAQTSDIDIVKVARLPVRA